MVNSTSYFQPDSPSSSPILTTGWICLIVILSPFQALRWLGRCKSGRAGKREKEGPSSPQFRPNFFFHGRAFSIQRTWLSRSLSTSTLNTTFSIFIIYWSSIRTQVTMKTRVFACFSVDRVSVARYLAKKPPQWYRLGWVSNFVMPRQHNVLTNPAARKTI